jgi:hypothetical protein
VTGPTGAGATSVLELSAGQQSALGGAPAIEGNTGQPLAEGLRIKFRTYAIDDGTPNRAVIQVWNLKDETASRIVNGEFNQVILQAGYVNGKYGIIFSGSLKQVKRGRESATETYIILYVADSDIALTQTSLDAIHMARGSSPENQVTAIQQQMQQKAGVQAGPIQGLRNLGGILPRSKIIWGMANENLNTTSKPLTQWSIQQGKLQVVEKGGYLPGEVVILNARSGLVDVPEATQQGIFVTCLLNPAIRVRSRIMINNASINTSEPAIATTQVLAVGYPDYAGRPFFASTSADGTYIVLVVEYDGETRGNPFYTHLVCLLLDQSSNSIAPGPALPTQFTPNPVTFPGHL